MEGSVDCEPGSGVQIKLSQLTALTTSVYTDLVHHAEMVW